MKAVGARAASASWTLAVGKDEPMLANNSPSSVVADSNGSHRDQHVAVTLTCSVLDEAGQRMLHSDGKCVLIAWTATWTNRDGTTGRIVGTDIEDILLHTIPDALRPAQKDAVTYLTWTVSEYPDGHDWPT